jgi:hypothetical protein
MTSGLFDLLLFERAHNRSDDELLIKLLAVSCILWLLGIIATPIRKRIAPRDDSPHKAILERGTIQTALTPGWDAGVSPSQSLSRRTERFSVALVPVLDVGAHIRIGEAFARPSINAQAIFGI